MRALALCSLLLIAVSLQAQPVVGGLAPSVQFGIQADFTNANFPGPNIAGAGSALKDVYGAGFGGGIHLDVAFAALSLRLQGDYLKFSPDNDKYRQVLSNLIPDAGQFSVSGGSIAMLSGHINAKMSILPLPIVKPYLTGGIGLARLSVDDATITHTGGGQLNIPGFSSDTQTMFDVGAGVDLYIGVTLFLEVRYTWIMTSPNTSTLFPVNIGVTF